MPQELRMAIVDKKISEFLENVIRHRTIGEKLELLPKKAIPRGSTLLIHAVDFLNFLFNRSPSRSLQLTFGDYDLLHCLVVRDVTNFRQSGIEPVFIFDQPGSISISLSDQLRVVKEHREEYENLSQACRNGYSKKVLPLPILAVEQLMDTLSQLGINCHKSCISSVQDMAKLCQNENRISSTEGCDRNCFVWSSYSDFLVFPNVPLIRMNDISYLEDVDTGMEQCYASHIWDMHDTLAILGITAHQLKEFFVSTCSYFASPLVDDVGHAWDLVVAGGDGYIAMSDDAKLSEAIQLCRFWLELKHVPCRTEQSSEVLPVDPLAGLDYPSTFTFNNILEVEDCSQFVKIAEFSSLICPEIRNEHRSALLSTYNLLSSSKSHPGGDYAKESIRFKVPSWDEYKPALLFQLIYKHWRMHGDTLGYCEVPPSPRHVFSCEIYLNCLLDGITEIPVTAEDISISSSTAANRLKIGDSTIEEPLPIDSHKEEILQKIHRDRLVLIHGETGCGKSTRLPLFLYEDAVKRNKKIKVLIAQPRRIAALNIFRRLRDVLGPEAVALRMGQGVKEGGNAPIMLLTTGKLVRYLSSNACMSCTHIVIDEVHERSLDSDLACFFVRELLRINPSVRVVLMSATMQYSLYQDYFYSVGSWGDLNCLSVGSRRFPVEILYPEDLGKVAEKISHMTSSVSVVDDTRATVISQLHHYVIGYIIKRRVKAGSGVLIFVPGIHEINDLYALFEDGATLGGGVKCRTYAIHSDVPLEEQESAFLPAADDEIKLVLATSAAESSITIPDVDVVIDLGIEKSIQFDELRHRSYLRPTWISKASAAQRSGRTGRVRPGVVYRLYSKHLFEKFDEHSTAEVGRMPMQDVIIRFRCDFETSSNFNGVLPLLENMIQPPSLENVKNSFQYLYEAGMITHSSDAGYLTPLGRFCGVLPMDTMLGKLIALGVVFGVTEEAVIMSCALSLQKSIFRVASVFVQKDPEELNDAARNNFFSTLAIDAGCYSEPIMYLRLLLLYEELPKERRRAWLSSLHIFHSRFEQFRTFVFEVMKTCAGYTSKNMGFPLTVRSSDLNDKKINLLRLLLVWTCHGNIIQQTPLRVKIGQEIDEVVIMSPEFSEAHLRRLMPRGITWSMLGSGCARVFSFLSNSLPILDPPPYSCLFRDASEAVRLLNSLKNVNASGIILRRECNQIKVVPGSAEWAQNRGTGGYSSDPDFFKLQFKTFCPSWNLIGAHHESTKIFLPRQSAAATAMVHSNAGSLFGVVHSTLVCESKTGNYNLMSNGVTLVPLGVRWLSLALRCIGSASDLSNSSDSTDENKLSQQEKELCQMIRKSLFSEHVQSVGLCEDVIQQVNDLFIDWIEPASGGDFIPEIDFYDASADKNMSGLPTLGIGSGLKEAVHRGPASASEWKMILPENDGEKKKTARPVLLKKFIISEGDEVIKEKDEEQVVKELEQARCREYAATLQSYYTDQANHYRIDMILKDLKSISQECIFCNMKHRPSMSLNLHAPELHVLLQAVDSAVETAEALSAIEPFPLNDETINQQVFQKISPHVVQHIVQSRLHALYGLAKKNGKTIFTESINRKLSSFLKEVDGLKPCQFCDSTPKDIRSHLLDEHFADIHNILKCQNAEKRTAPSNKPKKAENNDTSSPGVFNFSCPKCTHVTTNAMDFVEHVVGHIHPTISSMTEKKKFLVKVISPCPICHDKNVFMQFGQLMSHVSSKHVVKAMKVAESLATKKKKKNSSSLSSNGREVGNVTETKKLNSVMDKEVEQDRSLSETDEEASI